MDRTNIVVFGTYSMTIIVIKMSTKFDTLNVCCIENKVAIHTLRSSKYDNQLHALGVPRMYNPKIMSWSFSSLVVA